MSVRAHVLLQRPLHNQDLVSRDAEGLRELRAREKKLGIQPDLDLDGYLKATAMHGQRSNTITLLVMRLLGLEVSLPPHMVSKRRRFIATEQASTRIRTSAGGYLLDIDAVPSRSSSCSCLTWTSAFLSIA